MIRTCRPASTVPNPDCTSCQYLASTSSCRLRPRRPIATPPTRAVLRRALEPQASSGVSSRQAEGLSAYTSTAYCSRRQRGTPDGGVVWDADVRELGVGARGTPGFDTRLVLDLGYLHRCTRVEKDAPAGQRSREVVMTEFLDTTRYELYTKSSYEPTVSTLSRVRSRAGLAAARLGGRAKGSAPWWSRTAWER